MCLHIDTQMLLHRHPYLLQIYLNHGYKRHDSLHVFLQFGQGSQLARYHFVVWKGPVVALDRHQEKKKQVRHAGKREQRLIKTHHHLHDDLRRRSTYISESLHYGPLYFCISCTTFTSVKDYRCI